MQTNIAFACAVVVLVTILAVTKYDLIVKPVYKRQENVIHIKDDKSIEGNIEL